MAKADNTTSDIQEETNFDENPNINGTQDDMRLYMENYNRNEVRVAGTVRDIFVTEPKQKMKKEVIDGVEKKVPKLDDDGQAMYYESSAYITVSFDGGEMQLNLKQSLSSDLIVGRRYLFEGTKGLNYGTVQDKFHSITQL